MTRDDHRRHGRRGCNWTTGNGIIDSPACQPSGHPLAWSLIADHPPAAPRPTSRLGTEGAHPNSGSFPRCALAGPRLWQRRLGHALERAEGTRSSPCPHRARRGLVSPAPLDQSFCCNDRGPPGPNVSCERGPVRSRAQRRRRGGRIRCHVLPCFSCSPPDPSARLPYVSLYPSIHQGPRRWGSQNFLLRLSNG